jgi:DNA-binding transcriptional MerR regulator
MVDNNSNDEFEEVIKQMEEENGKWYSITEVSDKLKLNANTMRKYEEDFDLVIARDGYKRKYSDSDIQLFRQIMKMKEAGWNTTAIKTALKKSVLANDQKEANTQLMPLDKLTAGEFGELVAKSFENLLKEREEELKLHYESQMFSLKQEMQGLINSLEEKTLENNQKNNQKMDEILSEIKNSKSKGLFSKLFGK